MDRPSGQVANDSILSKRPFHSLSSPLPPLLPSRRRRRRRRRRQPPPWLLVARRRKARPAALVVDPTPRPVARRAARQPPSSGRRAPRWSRVLRLKHPEQARDTVQIQGRRKREKKEEEDFARNFNFLSRLLPENRQGRGGERGCSKCDSERQLDVRRFQEQLGLTRENRRSLRAISSRRFLSPLSLLFLFGSRFAISSRRGDQISPLVLDRSPPTVLHFYINFSLGVYTQRRFPSSIRTGVGRDGA